MKRLAKLQGAAASPKPSDSPAVSSSSSPAPAPSPTPPPAKKPTPPPQAQKRPAEPVVAAVPLKKKVPVLAAPLDLPKWEDTTISAVFNVTLSAPSFQSVKVNYATATGGSSGTATVGKDYVNAKGTLTFAPGETTKALTVVVWTLIVLVIAW